MFPVQNTAKVVAVDTSMNEYTSFIKKGIHEYTLEYTQDNIYNSRCNKVVIKCICKGMCCYYINGSVNVLQLSIANFPNSRLVLFS